MFVKTNEGYYIILHKDYLLQSSIVINNQIFNSIFNIQVYDVVYNINSAIENAYVIKKYELVNDIQQYINPIPMMSATYFNHNNIIHIDINKIIFNDGTIYHICSDIYNCCSDIVKHVRNKKLKELCDV